jgi:hypothetical protein
MFKLTSTHDLYEDENWHMSQICFLMDNFTKDRPTESIKGLSFLKIKLFYGIKLENDKNKT